MADTLNSSDATEDLGDVFDGVFDDGGLIADTATQAASGGDDTLAGAEGATEGQPDAGAATSPAAAPADTLAGAEGEDTTTAAAAPEAPLTATTLAAALKDALKPEEAPVEDTPFDILGGEEPISAGEPGYEAQQLRIVQFQRVNDNVNTSERFARIGPDKDIVDTVKTWAVKRFETDPAFAQRIMFDPDPYGRAIQEYKDQQVLAGVQPDELKDLEEFRAWKAAKAEAEALGAGGSTTDQPNGSTEGKTAAAKPAAASPAVKPVPPTSIADLPAAGQGGAHHVPAGPGIAFDSAFPN